eukprot:3247321-Rhodomonas_salina.1
MKEGKDYEDAFAPVQHATSARVIISITAADDLELHSCDLAQAFLQAEKLDEGVNGRVFITPPKGSNEDRRARRGLGGSSGSQRLPGRRIAPSTAVTECQWARGASERRPGIMIPKFPAPLRVSLSDSESELPVTECR